MKSNRLLSASMIFLMLCIHSLLLAQASLSIRPDSSFGNNGNIILAAPAGSFEYGNDMAIQTDNKILIAGYSGSNGSTPTVARYLENGDIDPAFGTNGYAYLHSYGNRGTCNISSISVLANGKIILSGRHDSLALTCYLARLKANGSLDSSFGTNGYAEFGTSYGNPQALVRSDGNIIFAYQTTNTDPAVYKLIKTDANGTVDALFGSGAGFVSVTAFASVSKFILCQDDAVLAAGEMIGGIGFMRFLANGNIDNSFGVSGLTTVSFSSTNPYFHLRAPVPVLQADNSIVAGLSGGSYLPIYAVHILANGSLDVNYGENGLGVTGSMSFDYSYAQAGVAFNNETLLAGFSYFNGLGNYGALMAQTSGGISDTMLQTNPQNLSPFSIKIVNGNKVLLAGNLLMNVGLSRFNIMQSSLAIQSFTALKQNDSTSLLNWSTATETNYHHFEIMRSATGTSNWEFIGNVAATGNSSITVNYSLKDSFPMDGSNYYRIKLVGNNGAYVYSSNLQLIKFVFGAPNCDVLVPFAYELTDHSAKLKFNSGGGTALYYQYAYAPDPNNWTYAEPPAGSIIYTSTDTTVTITGLSSTTRYFLWMRAKCSNHAATDWAASKFTTLCGVATVPYKENFTSNFSCIKNNQWYQNPDTYNDIPYGISLRATNGYISDWFFTQGFQMTAGTTYRIYFKYAADNLNTATESTTIKLQMARFPDSLSLVNPALLNMPFNGAQLYSAKDSFALFTPAVSGLYCAGFYSSCNYATGNISIPEVQVMVDPGVPSCVQNISPVNNALLSNCNSFYFRWKKINGAQEYNIYLSDSVYGINSRLVNYSPVTDTFFNFSLCGYPGDRFSWYVVPRAYGTYGIDCDTDSADFRMENPAAPANDLCANAQPLTVSNGFCVNPVKGVLINSTLSNPSDTIGICNMPFNGPPGSQAPVPTGDDVWYKLTVPSTGNLLVQISPFNNNQSAYTVVRAFSGTCGTLTPIACSYAGKEVLPYAGGYTPYSDRLKLTGLIPGENIYVRVSAIARTAESYFTICAYDTTASVLPDIATAANTCTDIQSLVIDSLAGNERMWVPLLSTDGKLIGEIHANGNHFGTVTGAVYINSGAVRTAAGTKYFDRNITITPSAFALRNTYSNPSIRLYVKNTELGNYNTAAGASPMYNFKVVENNDPCSSMFINPGKALGNITDTGFYKGDSRVSFSTGGFSSFYFYKGSDLPLPLKLLRFTVQLCNKTNACLYWQTANEENVLRFDIERSENGTRFNTVGKAAAQNRHQNEYHFTDDLSALTNGNGYVYYRLKQMDADGRFTYGAVVKIKLDNKHPVSIYPNPAHDQITISGASQFSRIQLVSMTGAVVKEWQAVQQNTIDISLVAKGIYLLKMIAEDGIQISKIVVE